jgi:beta-1,4-mannosyltransferase
MDTEAEDTTSPASAPVRVAFLPPPNQKDPAGFLALLSDAVEAAGARRVQTAGRGLRWSLTESGVDVVHLHWLEYVATPDPAPLTGWARTWLRVLRLVAVLLILRARRIGIVWTVHNLAPHETARPRAEAVLYQAVYLLADQIIVHSEYARARVRARFRGRGRQITVIPHANYEGAFAEEPRGRDEVRAALGLPSDAFVYLAFGIIRSYKRLPLVAEQFRRLEGENLRLLIAGTPSPPAEADALRAHAAADPRIVLRAEYVPDELVSGLHLAADAAVIAYADVFSSGALLLALTHGRPVVAPGGGTARELFAPPAVEFFAADADLAGALSRVRTGDRSGPARRSAQRFPWSQAAVATLEVYRRAAIRAR